MRRAVIVGILALASLLGCSADVETVTPSARLHQLQREVYGPSFGPREVFLVVDDAPTSDASKLRDRVPPALLATLLPSLHPDDWLDRDVRITVVAPSSGAPRELAALRGAKGTYRVTELAASVQRALEELVAAPGAPYPATSVARALDARGLDAEGVLLTSRDDESANPRAPDPDGKVHWRALFASAGACASGQIPPGLRLAPWSPDLWCVASEGGGELPLSADRPWTSFVLRASVARRPSGPACSVELAVEGGCESRRLVPSRAGACRASFLAACDPTATGLAGFCVRPASSWGAGDELLLFGGAVPRAGELLRLVCDLE